jgi:hypothetical protein
MSVDSDSGLDLRLGADWRLRGDFDLRLGDLAPPRRLERNPSIILYLYYKAILFFLKFKNNNKIQVFVSLKVPYFCVPMKSWGLTAYSNEVNLYKLLPLCAPTLYIFCMKLFVNGINSFSVV